MTSAADQNRRPILLSVLGLMALAVLIGLGTWQVKRLAWKRDLIAKVEARVDGPHLTLEQALTRREGGEDIEYLPVRIHGRFAHDAEIHLYANYNGRQGYYIITPLRRGDKPAVFVNRGFVPTELKNRETRVDGLIDGDVDIEGLLREPWLGGQFTPADDVDENIWFSRDLDAMAFVLGVEAAPVFVDSTGAEVAAFWPQGGVTRIDFSNRHLEYAITWYGLAVALIGVYGAYMWSGRRRRTH